MDEPDSHGDLTARLDQVHAEFHGVAQLTNRYLEAFEQENMPTELAHRLVADFHVEYWRAALSSTNVGRSALVDND